MRMNTTCKKCGGRLAESGDILVLSDGQELPIKKCKECKQEATPAGLRLLKC